MNKEEALEIIEETERDFKSKQDFLRGLQTLAKYDDNIMLDFEHDQCWVCDSEEIITKMTREDITELAKCGWFIDEDVDRWSHF